MMQTNTCFMSLPTGTLFSMDWMATPNLMDQEKVNLIAQRSYFKNWESGQLQNCKRVLNVGVVAALIGGGTSMFLMSIPGVILSGAALIICFIGRNAICREQILRCQQACLKLENWLLQLKEVAEKLKEKLESLVADPKNKGTESILKMDDKIIKDLLETIKKLPINDLTTHADKLVGHHGTLFGDTRSTVGGSLTDYWIMHHLKNVFGDKLYYFYNRISMLKEWIEHNQQELFWITCNDLLDSFLKPDHTKIDVYKNLPYPGIIEGADYWRQNIALFRHSLK